MPTYLHFPSRIHQHLFKTRSKKASIFQSVFASNVYGLLLDFGSQLGSMLATFFFKMGRGILRQASFFGTLYSFSIFWPSWPPLGAIWARFGKLWGSILEGFWTRFWEVLGSVLEASGDNLGLRLLFENLLFQSILLASGSGWAGGVTRSAKICLKYLPLGQYGEGFIFFSTCFCSN